MTSMNSNSSKHPKLLYRVVWCLVLVTALVGSLHAQSITKIRHFDTWNAGIIKSTDAAGIGYHPPSNHLYIADSEINETTQFEGNNIFETNLLGDQIIREIASNNTEPTGITYNEFDGFFYVSNDNTQIVARYDDNLNSPLAMVRTTDDLATATDPEGITSDPATGVLYVSDGVSGGRQVLIYNSDLQFQSSFSAPEVIDPEGIAFNTQNGNLFIVSSADLAVFEYTTTGTFIAEYDISGFSPTPISPQGVTFAPTSDPNDDPNNLAIYIADAMVDNDPDGRIFEADITSPSSPPVAQFSGSPLSGDAPLTVDFTDQSNGSVNSWSWDFGDGGTSTAQNPSYTYNAAGLYTVSLTVTGPNGSDTETKVDYVSVSDPTGAPVAAFSGSPLSGDAPLTVDFTDQSTGDIDSWSWDFGDGGTSTAQNPSYTYSTPDTYTVSLTVTGPGGSDTETKIDYITVTEPAAPPVAEFVGTPLNGEAPLTVDFTDQSTGEIESWSWDFGDGGTSTSQNPSHTYNSEGSYTVSLTVTGPGGSDTETKTNYVTVDPSSGPVTVSFQDGVNGYAGTRDTWMNGQQTSSNFGSATSLQMDGFPDQSTLISWDVSAIPSGSSIESVEITVDVTNTSGRSFYDFYEMKRAWVESQATFNEYASGQSWEIAGAQGSNDRGTTVLGSISTNSAGIQTFSLNSAGLAVVQSWVDDPSANNGFVIQNYDDGSSNGLHVSSRETSTIQSRPQLTVTYSGGGSAPPVADFVGSPLSGDVPLTVDFTDQTSGNVSSWSWDFGDGGTSTSQNPSYTYNAAGTYTVSLTVTGPGGSDTETKTDYITVTAVPPVAEFVGTPLSGDAPLTVDFTDQSMGDIDSWSWDFGDGGTSTAQNPSYTYGTPDTYTVSLTVTGPGGSDTETKVDYITVTEPTSAPVAEFVGSPLSGDAPLTVDFTDQSTGDIDSWSWDFGDGGTSTEQNPSYTYSTPDRYTVSLTVTGPGGSDTETKVDYITVTEPTSAPVAEFVGSPLSGDAPLTVDFTDQSTGDIDSWSWDFGDGGTSTAQNPSYTYSTPDTYTVSLTVTGPGGSDTETKIDYITVTEPATAPVAEFVGTPLSGEAPLTVDFTDQSTGDIDSWSWDFGDGGTSTAQSPSYTYSASGTYTVSLIVTGPGGSDTETKVDYITVDPSSGPVTITFQDGVDGYSGTRDTWINELDPTTNFGSSTTLQVDGRPNLAGLLEWDVTAIPSGSSIESVEITIDVTNTSGGSDYEIFELKQSWVEGEATYNQYASGQNWEVAGAQGTSDRGTTVLGNMTSTNTGSQTFSLNSAGLAVVQAWVDDPASNNGFVVLNYSDQNSNGLDFSSRESATVESRPQLTVTYSGGGSAPPVADFVGSPLTGDAPLTVDFTDQTSGSVSSWSWDFGDGGTSTAENPSYTYSSAGTYTVSLTVTGPGGSDTETKTDYITVTQPSAPVAEFVGNPLSGDAPLTVDFTDQSTGDIDSWSWDFGDGGTSTEQSPSYTYSTPDTYTVSLTVTGPGGSDTETKVDYVTVTEPTAAPVAEFVGTPLSGDAPLTVDFTDQSTGDIDSWSWAFGDGGTSTAQSPSYTYNDAGTYTVSLTVTGPGGSDTETKTDYVTVTSPPGVPVAEFEGTPLSGEVPLTVDFTDQSTGDIDSWSWDFGDGGTSTAQNPSYTYSTPDTYTVSLTVTGPGGSDTETKIDYITVTEPAAAPVAEFVGTPLSGQAPLTVDFTDQSTGEIDSWSWDFGDGGMSTEQNPSYTFSAEGTYTVSLTVTGPGGSDTETKTDYITVEPSTGPVTVSFQDGVNGYFGTRDTWTNELQPTTNFGSEPTLQVDGRPNLAVLLLWDISAIPSGSSIQTAEITINVSNTSSGSAYEIYELKQPWVEGEATYNEYAAGQSWEVAGIQGAGDRGTTVLGSLTADNTGSQTFSLNAEGLTVIQSWVNDPSANLGFVALNYSDTNSNGLDFASREDGSFQNRPELTITYAGGASPTDTPLALDKAETLSMQTGNDVKLPEQFDLVGNYPNPFNGSTVIVYALPEATETRIALYDVLGRTVDILVDGRQAAGQHRLRYDANDLAAGVYFIRMVSGSFKKTTRMLYVK